MTQQVRELLVLAGDKESNSQHPYWVIHNRLQLHLIWTVPSSRLHVYPHTHTHSMRTHTQTDIHTRI